MIAISCIIATLLPMSAGPSAATVWEWIARGHEFVAHCLYGWRCVADFGRGNATAAQLAFLIGEPADGFCLGSRIHFRYPNFGIDVVCKEGPGAVVDVARVIAIRRFPPLIPDRLSDAERKDMTALQGTWELCCTEENGKKEELPKLFRTYMLFEGDHVILVGGGVALGFLYKVNPAGKRKTLRVSLPDPDDEERFFGKDGAGKALRHVLYSLSGDTLRITLRAKSDAKDGTGGKRVVTQTFKRLPPQQKQ
jgi:uncharacterized protein (TIGR03067 family)